MLIITLQTSTDQGIKWQSRCNCFEKWATLALGANARSRCAPRVLWHSTHICVALKDKLVLVFVLNDRVGGKREMGAPKWEGKARFRCSATAFTEKTGAGGGG